MVSIWTILALVFSLLACFAFPIILCIVFIRKTHPGIKPLLVGIGVFIVFVAMEGIVNYTFFNLIPATKSLLTGNAWILAVYGGLAAGIFEETGRLAGFSLLLKKKREWKHGVTYGIGHGGIEALLVSSSALNCLIYAVMINTGTFDAILQSIPAAYSSQADSLLTVRNSLLSDPAWTFAVIGTERICAVTVQIALSILVLYAVSRKKYIYWGLAILLHAALDFPAGLYQGGVLPLPAVEGIVAVFAAAALIFILKSKKLFAAESAPVPSPAGGETRE